MRQGFMMALKIAFLRAPNLFLNVLPAKMINQMNLIHNYELYQFVLNQVGLKFSVSVSYLSLFIR